MMKYGSLSEMSGNQRNGTPRNSMVFWKTKNNAMNTGSGICVTVPSTSRARYAGSHVA